MQPKTVINRNQIVKEIVAANMESLKRLHTQTKIIMAFDSNLLAVIANTLHPLPLQETTLGIVIQIIWKIIEYPRYDNHI